MLQWQAPEDAVAPSVKRAADLPAESDAAVVFVRPAEGENRNRLSLKLPQTAESLIRSGPRPTTARSWRSPASSPDRPRHDVAAQRRGRPSVLVHPWGSFVGPDDPSNEGIDIGYRGYAAEDIEPLFALGHGLSYGEFDYSRLRVSNLNRDARTTKVGFIVRDTGPGRGVEVGQVYMCPLPTSETPRKLVGSDRVTLKPVRQQRMTVQVDRRDVSYSDLDEDRWVTPSGDLPLYVGASATDARLVGTPRVRRSPAPEQRLRPGRPPGRPRRLPA